MDRRAAGRGNAVWQAPYKAEPLSQEPAVDHV